MMNRDWLEKQVRSGLDGGVCRRHGRVVWWMKVAAALHCWALSQLQPCHPV